MRRAEASCEQDRVLASRGGQARHMQAKGTARAHGGSRLRRWVSHEPEKTTVRARLSEWQLP